MSVPKWISWAGLAAMIGGGIAVIMTLPFALGYHIAYPGDQLYPFWGRALRPGLILLLDFASPTDVYNTYGRVYDLVYLLMLPAAFALHQLHKRPERRMEKWGFYILVGGLIATFIGTAGDYWLDGIGFPLELLGLLTLGIGAAVTGIAALRDGFLPAWLGWLLIACLPGLFGFIELIGHIPSGPTFLFAVSWGLVGYQLWKTKLVKT